MRSEVPAIQQMGAGYCTEVIGMSAHHGSLSVPVDGRGDGHCVVVGRCQGGRVWAGVLRGAPASRPRRLRAAWLVHLVHGRQVRAALHIHHTGAYKSPPHTVLYTNTTSAPCLLASFCKDILLYNYSICNFWASLNRQVDLRVVFLVQWITDMRSRLQEISVYSQCVSWPRLPI